MNYIFSFFVNIYSIDYNFGYTRFALNEAIA